jgi:hypothetical protein
MRIHSFGLAAIALAAFSPLALADLTGSPVNMTTSTTGATTILPLGGPTAATVGAGNEFTFCVGPNASICPALGWGGTINLSATQITFATDGSSLYGAAGTFTIVLSGLSPTITGVTFNPGASGTLNYGTLAVTSFNAHSITFTGTATYAFEGGANLVFDVTTASGPTATPVPPSVILAGGGVASAAFYEARRRRRRAARCRI